MSIPKHNLRGRNRLNTKGGLRAKGGGVERGGKRGVKSGKKERPK